MQCSGVTELCTKRDAAFSACFLINSKAHGKTRAYKHLSQYFFRGIKLMLKEILRETCNFFPPAD